MEFNYVGCLPTKEKYGDVFNTKITGYMVVRKLLPFLLGLIVLSGVSHAQIVGSNTFLQGAYLEVGMVNIGAFGASSTPVVPAVPTVYHPHPFSGPSTPGDPLAMVYDWGHDGWAVGTPAFMGDYTWPGTPFEGWELQIGTGRTQAMVGFGTPAYVSGGSGTGLTGGVTAYSNSGGLITGTWNGSASGGSLQISQETRIDTLGSAIVVTTKMKNTSTTIAVPNVYYLRTCDPDDEQTSTGSFSTNNTIVHQNEDDRHMVMVSSKGTTFPTQAYMALATKDCRAKALIYSGWPLSSSIDLGTLWDGSFSSGTYTIGHSVNSDVAIGLVYKIGTIAASDSAVISYAYVFNGDNGIDSAFPDPQIVINGVPHTSWAPPTPNYDTFDVCQYPGMSTLPVKILNATDKDWSWSHWTWAPGTGLSATTGTEVNIDVHSLPVVTTFTITGSDSASGMYSCNKKIFYLTVYTCNGATVNNPCVGDTLKFNAPGDSTDATYVWFGPAPSTAVFSTSQANFRFPATMADSGTYTVIKSVSGVVVDTSTCHATIHPLPLLTVTSSIGACAPITGPLVLNVVPDSACSDFVWTGPNGFTSGIQSPSIPGFDSSGTGTYFVQATSIYGCKSTDSVHVWPGVTPDFNFTRNPGCPGDSVVFNNATFNANIYSWNFGDGSPFDANRNPPMHIYTTGHNIYNVTLTASNTHCSNMVTKTIDVRHSVTADFAAQHDTICNQAPIIISDLSSASKYGLAVSPLYGYVWRFGDGSSDSSNGAPAAHTYAMEGIYNVTLVVRDSLQCEDSISRNMYIIQPYMHTVSDTMFCLTQPLALYNNEWISPDLSYSDYGFTYSWTPATNLNSATAHVPLFNATGTYTYNLTATLNHFGCQVSHDIVLNSILPAQLHNVTTSTTIMYGSSIALNADSELNYTWTPNDGSLNNPNINTPVATPSVTTTYTVYGMDNFGCRDTATVVVIVDSTQIEFNPTAFTPNGDGLNDKFHLIGAKFQNLVEMRVFNRWGQCVFVTSNKEDGWDGNFNGVPQDIGTYTYHVIVARPGYGDNVVYKGTLTLIR